MANANKVTELKGGAHVELVDAEVVGLSWKKGEATITLKAVTKNIKGTRREMDKIVAEGFNAQVVIEGEIVQTEIDFDDDAESSSGAEQQAAD